MLIKILLFIDTDPVLLFSSNQ